MTLEEAEQVAAIASTADRGCSHCVDELRRRLQRAFPEFTWTYGPNPTAPPPAGPDSWELGDEVEEWFESVILVAQRDRESEKQAR